MIPEVHVNLLPACFKGQQHGIVRCQDLTCELRKTCGFCREHKITRTDSSRGVY